MSRDSAPWVLGIGASNHNGAACLLRGDELVVAVQEERLLRRKRAWLPGGAVSFAVRYCLETAGIRADELSLVSCCSLMGPRGPLYDVRANPDLAPGVPVRYLSHHLGHAVGAFATSGFDESLVLVVDGFGSNVQDLSPEELAAVVTERRGEETLSVYHASREGFVPVEKHLGTFLEVTSSVDLERFRGMPRFGSLGGLYSAVGRQLFSDVLEGPGKVMGLAPHGVADTPVSDFFDIVDGRFVFHDTVPRRFTHDERWPARQVEYRNLAASAQAALEDGLLRLVRRLRASTSCDALCYAGGVALNSVANERLFTESGFKDLYVMPAAEDSGTAIGAAYHGLWQLTGRRSTRRLGHDSTGRTYSAKDCDTALRTVPAVVSRRLPRLVPEVADLLAEGKMLGWFQGGSELGPRSLGQRSILCDPRPRDMKDTLNARVKFREGFRPFAPVILAEKVREWFDVDTASTDSPFMLRVWRFREEQRERVPAVAHVNGTGRVQTVTREHTPLLHALLTAFDERTGVPVLLNTSFNIAGEPIVETPEDALWGLLSTGLEGCVLLDRFVSKHEALHSLLDLEVLVLGERIAPLSSESAEDTLDLRPLLKEPLGFGLDASGRNLEDARRMLGSGQQGGAFKVRTPWGAAVQLVSSELSMLVAQVERGMTGWKLLERVSREDSNIDEQKLTRMLGTLRRAHVLQFGPGV